MSRRFVKSFPFTAEGFGIETELTVHAVRLMMPMAEVDTRYKERPVGSVSKLNTYRDGFRILFTIAQMLREERPLLFFSAIAFVFALARSDPGHIDRDRVFAYRAWCRACRRRCWPPA